MNKVFNKLVRDKIPEIIKNNNEEAITRVLNDEEYKKELFKKLQEEYNEVIETDDSNILEELADMLEVIEAIANLKNKTLKDVMEIKEEKKELRGGFRERIFLIETKNNEN